jgi:hypothetical protein
MKKNTPLLAFFGHHKGATDWMNSILAQICKELKLRFSVVHYPEMFDGDLKNYVITNKVDVLSFDNADYEFVKQLENFKGFHVIRDPRDITVSAYYSHLHSHGTQNPWFAEQRKVLQSLSKSEGLLYEMQSRKDQFRAMHDWDYNLPNVMEVKMEEMTGNPYKYLANVFDFLDLADDTYLSIKKRVLNCYYCEMRRLEAIGKLNIPFAPKKLHTERMLGIFWENEFSRKTRGRELGQENVRSHYRKGTPGDWKNHFEDVHYDYFQEHYQHVLGKLGYERDASWVRSAINKSEGV